MVLQEYLITGKKSLSSSITLGFDTDGILSQVKFEGEVSAKARAWFLNHLPIHYKHLEVFAKENAWTVKPLNMDLSFETFYETYGNKVGKKRAESRWKKMTQEQKIKALLYIDKYNNQLKLQPGVQKMYPESYLNAERWND